MRSAMSVRRRGAPWLRLLAIGSLAWLGLLAAASGPSVAQKGSDEKSWQGTWNNRAKGTSGPLKCTVTPKNDKTWDATFEGTFMGRGFSHKVSIDVRKQGERTLLQGTANVGGDTYTWQGSVVGRALNGSFRSGKGNRGDFKLQN